MLKTILRMTQEQLFNFVAKQFPDNMTTKKRGSYILVEGMLPVLLVAHLDTVHQYPPDVICEGEGMLMAPSGIGGDDRCGVYALLKIYNKMQERPSLLFCCDEEIGGVGAYDFTTDFESNLLPEFINELYFMVEIDRRGVNDMVFYSCNNKDFMDFWENAGFNLQYGSFSDISILMPVLGIAGVNLSAGYYNEHTSGEVINTEALEFIIDHVIYALSKPLKKYIYVGDKFFLDRPIIL